MADNEEQANLVVSAVNEATATLQDIQKGFEDFEGSAQSLGITSVALGGILKDILMKAFEELKDMVKLGIDEAIDAEQVHMKLVKSFKEEGASANASVTAIQNASDALSDHIGICEDEIKASATVIRQLTGLSGTIIATVLPAIGDLSTFTGDYNSAASMVARAINGQGMAFQRLGIHLDLTEDKAKNLNTVMTMINEKFGGVAQANMETTGGKIQALKVTFTDVAKEIGNAVIQSGIFNDALKATQSTLSLLKGLLAGESKEAVKQNSAALKNLAEQYNEVYNGAEKVALPFQVEEEVIKRATAAAQVNTEKKKELSDEELQKISDNLQKEVEAYKNEIKQIDEINAAADKANLEKNINPKFESVSQDQLDTITSVEEAIYGVHVSYIATIDDVVSQEQALMQEFASNIAGMLAGTLGNLSNILYANFLNDTKSGLDKAKDFWIGFGMEVVSIINRILAKMAIMAAAKAIFNSVGGVGFLADALTPLLSFQTHYGDTRTVPGPMNVPVPIIAHGGEVIGRPDGGGGGGLQVTVMGDVYGWDEAMERIRYGLFKHGELTGATVAG
jgi:hypothetical protein